MLKRSMRSMRSMRSRARQSGLSLVELMVGIAVGMFVVAAAATLVASQLTDNRRLLLELQVQQDLRATADIITRDLRRIGVTGPGNMVDGLSQTPVWDASSSPPSAADTVYNVILVSESDEIQFNSTRKEGQTGPFGYKRFTNNASGTGVIKSRMPEHQLDNDGGWTDLTDVDAINITAFSLRWINEPDVQLVCPKLCPATSDRSCWPTITVRAIEITIRGEAKSDPSVVREVRSVARLRNDLVDFKVDTTAASPSCPS